MSKNYIRGLLKPTIKKTAQKRAWGVELEAVWVPFFTATNTQGDTNIPKDVLGAPLRLAKDTDGMVRFSKSGKPVLKIARELSTHIGFVRDNFVADLVNHTNEVISSNLEAYKAEVAACQEAAKPIMVKANADLGLALAIREAAETTPTSEGEITPAEAVMAEVSA